MNNMEDIETNNVANSLQAMNVDTEIKYWCHQCRAEMIPLYCNDDILCPHCKSDFIEQIEKTTTTEEHPSTFISNFGTQPEPQVQTRQPIQTNSNRQGVIFTRPFGAPNYTISYQQTFPLQTTFMQSSQPQFSNFFQQILSPSLNNDNNNQFPFFFPNTNGMDPLLSMMSSIMGANGGFQMDYGGGNLEQLLNQLFEASAGRYGPPPASKSVRDTLKTIDITQNHVDNKEECAICKEEFCISESVKQLPCGHNYHDTCISPWLETRNSCPVCRYELPTDDADYENRKRTQNNQSARR